MNMKAYNEFRIKHKHAMDIRDGIIEPVAGEELPLPLSFDYKQPPPLESSSSENEDLRHLSSTFYPVSKPRP